MESKKAERQKDLTSNVFIMLLDPFFVAVNDAIYTFCERDLAEDQGQKERQHA